MKKILLILFTTMVFCAYAQQKQNETIPVLMAKYDGGDIVLQYHPQLPSTDSITVNVYRKGKIADELIRANKKIAANHTWIYVDTFTRINPGVYQYRIETLVSNENRRDEVWAYAYPADVIPVAQSIDIKSIKGENAVLLNWQIANNFMVRTITIQRSRKKDSGYTPIATLAGNETSLVDYVNDANEPFFYRIDMTAHHTNKVYQSAGVFTIPQFKIIPAKVQNIKAEQTDKNIMVSWESNDAYSRAFYIKKRSRNQGDFIPASVAISANNTQKYQWSDTASSLVNNEMYQYVVIAESNSYDQSLPSDTATISYKNKGIRLNAPQDLRILTVNDTTYHLVWTVDSLQNENNAAFIVYFKAKKDHDFKLLSNGTVPATQNYFQVPKPKDGDTYQLKAIQENRSSAFSLAFTYHNAHELNFGPKYLKAVLIDEGLLVKWTIHPNLEVSAYKLYKWDGKDFKLIENVSGENEAVVTQKYQAGKLNIYKLVTVSKNGVENTGSELLQVN
jgi:hypothetical protein